MSNDEPQTLRDVAIAASVRNGGVRGRGLGRIADSKGLSLSYTTVDKMLDGTYKSKPGRKTLEALSILSGYTIEQVYRAAKVPLPLKPLRDDLPADADLLTGSQRRVVIDAIRLFAQQNRELATLRAVTGEDGERHVSAAANQAPEAGPAKQPAKSDFDLAANDESHDIEDEQGHDEYP